MSLPTNLSGAKAASRREYLKAAAAAGAATALDLRVVRNVHAAGGDVIKIALVGCGARGSRPPSNALAAKANVKLVAMADAFKDSLEAALGNIQERFKDRVDVPEARRFVGLDAYHKAIDSGVDAVLLCTPPGFRPLQFEAAVKAGKHVFMEKPLATDAPGVRRIMAANEEAKKKKLAVAVGHHLRHERRHREIVQRIHDGAIGTLNFLRATGVPAASVRPRQPGQSEMQYQSATGITSPGSAAITLLSSTSTISTSAIGWPDRIPWRPWASAAGRRGVGKDFGEIFDHHAVEFTYADGLKLFSVCHHFPNAWMAFSDYAHGAKGTAELHGYGNDRLSVVGQQPVRWKSGLSGYQVEMDELFAAIAAGEFRNEADWAVESTMTALLGRMAAYSGKVVTWEEAIHSRLDLRREPRPGTPRRR